MKAKAKPLDYYPSVDENFQELARQSNTKLSILARAKATNHPIEEPLTDKEKEEDYELRLYISTFMSEDIPTEDTIKLQLMTIPQPLQIESASTENHVAVPTEQSIIPTHQQEGGEDQIEEDIESDNLEYAMTK